MIDFSDIDIEETKQSDSLSDKEFVDFLVNNDIYDKFINNLHMEVSASYHSFYRKDWMSIETFCDDLRWYDYVEFAFVWVDSPEGKDFWNNVHQLWMKDMKKMRRRRRRVRFQ